LGGVQARVATGKATRFRDLSLQSPTTLIGSIVTVADDQPVSGGEVIVTARFADREENVIANVNINGGFMATVTPGWTSVQGYYIAIVGLADSTSDEVSSPW
jgi:hypothetical protein